MRTKPSYTDSVIVKTAPFAGRRLMHSPGSCQFEGWCVASFAFLAAFLRELCGKQELNREERKGFVKCENKPRPNDAD
jgi:hypothetical protein